MENIFYHEKHRIYILLYQKHPVKKNKSWVCIYNKDKPINSHNGCQHTL